MLKNKKKLKRRCIKTMRPFVEHKTDMEINFNPTGNRFMHVCSKNAPKNERNKKKYRQISKIN